MRIKNTCVVGRHDLKDAMSRISAASSQAHTIIPMFKAVRLRANREKLELRTSNLELQQTTTIDCDGNAEFEHFVDANLLYKAATLSTNPALAISPISETKLGIDDTGTAKLTLACFPKDSAIEDWNVSDAKLIAEAKQSDIESPIRVAHSCLPADDRPGLNGIIISRSEATNWKPMIYGGCGLSLMAATIPCASDSESDQTTEFNVSCPGDSLLSIFSSKSNNNISLSYTDSVLVARNDKDITKIRLIEYNNKGAAVLDYALTRNPTKHCTVKLSELRASVRLVASVCDEMFGTLTLKASNGRLLIKTSDKSESQAQDEVLVMSPKEELDTIMLNGSRLLKILNLFESELVTVGWQSPTDGFVINAVFDSPGMIFRCFLAPVSPQHNSIDNAEDNHSETDVPNRSEAQPSGACTTGQPL